ncbi:hypothetical protein SAMN02745857_03413 [Andreprevotia lacus DSM 23236]|jgi:hypothetical protein|uniref:Uncharacterized protein n=1 Tax=Andreprevotia lacus DSM 23236 TaxID=1121001 RepID=A0A1W1XY57_9NEIS|nr:hypothetical protein [Andreprevotia lacus]SMC28794.1 hypothetical protein SAMN02745857_03413 [Andreprevotia lacus DSM 23236]
MNSAMLVKLFAGPAVIGLASLAGKRWGPGVAGLLGGMPLISSCVIAALWLQYGQDYATQVASASPVGLWGNLVYMLAVGYASIRFDGQRWGWLGILLCGWFAYAAVALLVVWAGIERSLLWGLLVLPSLLLAARYLLPAPKAAPRLMPLPRVELLARMLAAFLLVTVLTGLTQLLGPGLTGLLAPSPVVATVLPAFTMAGAGSNAVLLQMRGFLIGLVGMGASLICLAPLAVHLNAWAAPVAILIAIASGLGANWLMQRVSR